MKKLIQKSQKSIASQLASFARILGVIACLAITNIATAQVDCNTTMACNDGLQVSLDENCVALITPDMILEDPLYPNSDYTVVLMDGSGQELPSTEVNYSYVNQTLSVNIQLNGCAAACWGNITIEDKLPPAFVNCENIIVDCADDLTPGQDVPAATAVDACGPVTNINYFDQEETDVCADDFVKVVTRTWTATDEQGNQATCEQLIYVQKANIVDIVFPGNYDDVDNPVFECGTVTNLLPNGAPSPDVTGYPVGTACPNIQTYYTDIIFDICGSSVKVLRQWVVVDWCTGEERSENQIIKIVDTNAPVCSALPDFTNDIPTDEGLCTGTFEVPAPTVIYECSDWSYTVGYKLRDENGDPFENAIYDNVTFDIQTGLYSISGLPADTSWIIYTLTDACGNSSMCFTEVLVTDNEAPIPVCEGYTVVGLEDAGWADIFASSIDDGSFDNCEVDKFEVKRESTPCGFSSDLTFGEKVNFCCEDVSAGYIRVVMRVYDKAGNFNDCIVNVNVQDKINPTIECPAHVTISCTQDYTDLNLTGEATGFDNCSVEITHTDNPTLDDCGKGSVSRTWTATDPQGRSATCVQIITVADLDPFSASDINWPSDREVNGCDPSNASPEELNSFPILSNVDCTDIAISYDDDVFYNTPDYCIKVLRHWKIADWCNYDPQNPTFFEYTQKIGFYNTVAPTFVSCEDQSFTSTNGDCQEEVTIAVNASDDCTPDAQLKYSYTLDLDNNGSVDYNGNTNTFTRTLQAGTHRVIWKVIDACFNESTCSQLITVTDTKAPTPICLGELVWVLGEDGSTEVWASDFNLKSEAACGLDSDLIFSFNAAGTQQALTFTCADVPNGIASEINLEMHVIDASGNSEFCDVTLILQDSESSNACIDQNGNRAFIGGSIVNTSNNGLVNIEVELMDMDAEEANMGMTSDEGKYMFEDVNFYGDYVVAPHKNNDASNGVTTLDLVMIQRHILGLAELDSPYKLIAADINGNDKLQSSDLLMMRKVILGIETTFGDNTSWRFIPTTHEIEDPTYPFGFPEKVEFDELYLSNEEINFTAIKTGDINGNASNNVSEDNEIETRSGAKAFYMADQLYSANENVVIEVLANEVRSMIGMQFSLEYNDATLSFESISSGKTQIKSSNISIENGQIVVSWNDVNARLYESEDVLFTVNFVAKSKGQLSADLSLGSKTLSAEVYDESLTIQELVLEIGQRSIEEVASVNALHQNSPNPFKELTTIGFDLEERGIATIAIFDIAGKELYRMTNEFNRGYNEMTIDVKSLNASSGILYYTLRSGDFIDTKKMILID